MANPIIAFNSTTGSDTAASGAGPATAITGTAAAHTGGIASTMIQLTNSPDLSGLVTDGSAALWVKTPSGRQFSKITAADNGAKTVTVEDNFTISSGAACNYAIGGIRASIDNVDSRTLFGATGFKPGWKVDIQSTQVVTASVDIGINGTAASMITIFSSGSRQTISCAVNGVSIFAFYGRSYIKIKNLRFLHTAVSRGYGLFWNSANGRANIIDSCIFEGCSVGVAGSGEVGIESTIGGDSVIINCLALNCTQDGFRTSGLHVNCVANGCGRNGFRSAGGSGLTMDGCIAANNAAEGALSTSFADINNCTFYNNSRGVNTVGTGLFLRNSVFYGHSGYAVYATAGVETTTCLNNAFGANTSGNYYNITPNSGDVLLGASPFTDAAALDFSLNNNTPGGAQCKAVGYPSTLPGVSTATYGDIGAAQAQGGTTEEAGTYAAISDVRLGVDRGDGQIGTLAVPARANVRNGVAVDNTTGTAIIPGPTDVRSGVGVDATTGSLVVPAANKVRNDTTYDNGTQGTLTLPAASNVRSSIQYGGGGNELTGNVALPIVGNVRQGVTFGASGNEFNGTYVPPYAARADVRLGVDRGDGQTGLLDLPVVANVRNGVLFDNNTKTGLLVVPSSSDVRYGTTFDNGTSGALRLPAIADVKEGVGFGNNGVEFTGTYVVVTVTLPARANVRLGVDRGDGQTGLLNLPAIADVRAGTTFDNGTKTGLLVVPSINDVRLSTVFDNGSVGVLRLPAIGDVKKDIGFGANGSEFVGTYFVFVPVLPSRNDVRLGVDRGDGLTGLLDIITDGTKILAGYTQDRGIVIGSHVEAVPVYPSRNDVRFGINRGDGLTGTLTLPLVSKVLIGTQYGANGTEFVGTLEPNGASLPVITENTYASVRLFAMEYFRAQWADETKINWPNETFDPKNLPAWVRFNCQPAGRDRALMTGSVDSGKSLFGVLTVEIFVPAGTGPDRAGELVDKTTGIFDEKTFELTPNLCLTFNVPEPDEIGDDGKGWFQTNVSIPFETTES